MDYEKLGAFFLGHVVEPDTGQATDAPLLYDAKDLTTHGLCVGMTGSGKTGLCLALLEEAAIDGIPAIAIDPKGDLGNLLLTFPELRPADFLPWIDTAQATRAGRTLAEHAATVARQWRQGLASTGQDASRIQRLRDTVELALYTPGSSAGRPLSVLRQLTAPPPAVRDDPDAMRERLVGSIASLLALLGIEADPLRSREHILLSTIVAQAWNAGHDVELGELVRATLEPKIERIGVLDLDTFYPARDRRALAMQLNSLLASPSLAAWTQGEPLDIGRLLSTPQGKPRLSILSIAHLSDEERMFFVTTLLHELVAWMRGQAGTSSLRALLYMDEVFGFFPPVANPPSKPPMLTLLKQARAFGIGVMLATQNPMDLDYKGLSNCGTWFLGRLQTERDRMRVLDALEAAATGAGQRFDRKETETLLAGLPSRVFLMNDVHEDAPALFRTRWALSYLRGPLTRPQIRTLTAALHPAPPANAPAAPGASASTAAAASGTAPTTNAAQTTNAAGTTAAAQSHPRDDAATERPIVPPELVEQFLLPDPPDEHLLYRPGLLARAELHYAHRHSGLDAWLDAALIAALTEGPARELWSGATMVHTSQLQLSEEPRTGARYAPLPSKKLTSKKLTALGRSLKTHLYRNEAVLVHYCAPRKLWSRPGESRADFAARVGLAIREDRDRDVEKLRARFAPKLAKLQERVRKAQQKLVREQSQQRQQKYQTAVSVGATLLGAAFGRRSLGRATTAMRGAGRVGREGTDVAHAAQNLSVLHEQMQELEAEFQQALADAQRGDGDTPQLPIEERLIRPRKGDLNVTGIALAWLPWRMLPGQPPEPAWRFGALG